MSERARELLARGRPPLRLNNNNFESSAWKKKKKKKKSNDAAAANSPMSNLALDLSVLSTGRRHTPKRRLSLSSNETPSPQCFDRLTSVESGCFGDSPPLDSPTFDFGPRSITRRMSLSNVATEASYDFLDKENVTIQSTNSTSSDYCRNSVVEFEDNDSGLGMDKDEAFKFAQPVGVPPRKLKLSSEDTCSPKKYSPVKAESWSQKNDSPSKGRSLVLPTDKNDFSLIKSLLETSPVKLKESILTSADDSPDQDDGFLEQLCQGTTGVMEDSPLSQSISFLMNAPLLNKEKEDGSPEDDVTPTSTRMLSRRKIIQRSQSFDVVRSQPFSYKRDRTRDENTPVMSKRRRKPTSDDSPQTIVPACLHRSHSETEATIKIKSAVNKIAADPDLIGDCSKMYLLPTIRGKHGDLKSISPETLFRLHQNLFSDEIGKLTIVDCRYPYEFKGGHIQGAINIFQKDAIIAEFLKRPYVAPDLDKRMILVFHCEFSSERAPNLARFLRNRDRDANNDCYPALHYPEIYLLEGGYKAFFEQYKELCEPSAYTPMLHKEFVEHLKHFRAKSKSWAGDRGNRPGLRNLKF